MLPNNRVFTLIFKYQLILLLRLFENRENTFAKLPMGGVMR